jgi:hypothetical protein
MIKNQKISPRVTESVQAVLESPLLDKVLFLSQNWDQVPGNRGGGGDLTRINGRDWAHNKESGTGYVISKGEGNIGYIVTIKDIRTVRSLLSVGYIDVLSAELGSLPKFLTLGSKAEGVIAQILLG